MKYNERNKPLVCMMTQSTCYKGTRKFTPKGVLWHSTGANNPNLKRYVQPDDKASNRAELLALLGKNQYNNDWNHIDRQAGMNFWIGKLADGTVAAVQTMPWEYRPWGCGKGDKGTCNDTHIQFEICEDALTDETYFNACYKEACEMTAYLCKMYGIDPKGTISYNGLKVPTIIDHIGSHNLGLGNNHGDVQHWFKRFGKTLDNVRSDVAALMAGETVAVAEAPATVQATPSAQATTAPVTLSATHSKYINSTGTHYISNSGKDENNAYTGGKAGDQSGHEWELKAWYNRPWSVVLRYPDQAVALKIAQLSIDAALNDKIGYDQGQRTTYWAQLKAVGFDPSKITVACEEDCTAGVSANVMAAGHLFGIKALQNVGSCSSRNMKAQFTKAGFKALTDSKYLTGPKYLLPGDILLYESHHAAANVTLGAKVKDEWKPTASSVPTTTATPAVPTATTYYRVRKSWADKSSQIGAFTVFQNAKNCVDANPGYAAFDDGGNQVYPVAEKSFSPYRVKVSIPDLNYRIGPATTYTSYGYIEPGEYTIVGEENGWGLLEEFASLRNGWICLDYAKKV